MLPAPPNPDDAAHPTELANADDIRACLERLIGARCSVLLQIEDRRVPSQWLARDGDTVLLDAPRDEDTFEALLAAPRIALESAIERVTVRCSSAPAGRAEHQARPALRLRLPERVQYLQRRDHVRRTPFGLTCTYRHELGDGRRLAGQARIEDISGGGVALLSTEDTGQALAAGDVLSDCLIDLEPFGPVRVNLRVLHARRVHHEGRALWRAGCRFVDTSPAIEARLLRYVARLDRQHAAQTRMHRLD